MTQKSGFSTFIAELRRRRVFRVAAVYGGVAFVLFQIIDSIFEPLHIPEWIGSLLIILLLVGFPLAMALAWVFDITPEGIVRTEGRSTGKPLTGNGALIAVAIAAILFGIWGRWGGDGRDSAGLIRTIAVLPLDNLSGDPKQDYFVNGMHDALISELSKISALTVRSRQSTLQYRNSDKTVPEIAAELRVDALVEGSVMLLENRVTINTQLVNSQDEHLWTNNFDRNLEDVIALHREVARAIAREIKATLTPDEETRLTTARQVNPEAYQLYLLARELIFSIDGQKELEQGLEYLNNATSLDPEFVEAHAMAAVWHVLLYWRGNDPTEQRLDAAKQALDAALRLAPDDPAVLVARGTYHFNGIPDYPQAIADFSRALALAPSNAEVHAYVGYIHKRLGDSEEAVIHQMKGFELDPGNSTMTDDIGFTYRALKDLAQAQAWFERTVELNPEDYWGYVQLARIIIVRTGNAEEALAVLERGARIVDTALLQPTWVYLEFQAGRYAAALGHATAMPDDYSFFRLPKALWMGRLHDQLGRADSARHYLNMTLEKLTQRAAALKNYIRVAHIYTSIGLTYAYLGREEEALAASARADELLPLAKDAVFGVNIQRYRAQIFTVLGRHGEALNILADLLGRPGPFVINELIHQREWVPLRNHPLYAVLLEKYEVPE